jgi:hypothetical protein
MFRTARGNPVSSSAARRAITFRSSSGMGVKEDTGIFTSPLNAGLYSLTTLCHCSGCTTT